MVINYIGLNTGSFGKSATQRSCIKAFVIVAKRHKLRVVCCYKQPLKAYFVRTCKEDGKDQRKTKGRIKKEKPITAYTAS